MLVDDSVVVVLGLLYHLHEMAAASLQRLLIHSHLAETRLTASVIERSHVDLLLDGRDVVREVCQAFAHTRSRHLLKCVVRSNLR